MKPGPALKDVMTAFPYSIEPEAPLVTAKQVMEDHKIHHLPVMSENKVVALLSERDIRLAESPGHPLSQDTDLLVKDVAAEPVFAVQIHDCLADVVAQMAEKHVGSAVVMKGEKLAGILTSSDIYKAFGLLWERVTPSNPDDVIA